MRRALVIVLMLAACGGTDAPQPEDAATTTAAPTTTLAATTSTPPTTAPETTSAAPAETTAAPTTSAAPTGALDLRIEQLVFAGEPFLIIGNGGEGAGSTDGYFICQFPDYFRLPAVTLGPGEKLAVPLGTGTVPELVGVVAVAEATNPVGTIRVASGELGLYSRSEFNSADALVDYLEWGNGGHARSGVAVDAGQWVEGGFVELPEEVLAIVAEAYPTTAPEDWFAEIGG